MSKNCEEVCVIGKLAAAVQKISGDPEVLTGVEELAVALGGDGVAHPVGPAIEMLAEAVSDVADAINRLAQQAGAPAASCECRPRAAVPTAVPDVPVAVPYAGKTRDELRALCKRAGIHTNSKMNLTKLTELLRIRDARVPG